MKETEFNEPPIIGKHMLLRALVLTTFLLLTGCLVAPLLAVIGGDEMGLSKESAYIVLGVFALIYLALIVHWTLARWIGYRKSEKIIVTTILSALLISAVTVALRLVLI